MASASRQPVEIRRIVRPAGRGVRRWRPGCASNAKGPAIGRRDVLRFGAAAGLLAAGLGGGIGAARAAEGSGTALTPDAALAALKEGNARYVAEPELCVLDLAESRKAVAGGQAPWATVIACADSRVPPELIFGGHGVGELFVARNAGNLVDTATLGTVEYGAAVLGSPLIVVLAHTSCGAVKAACDVVTKNATYPGAIGPMIEPIVPAALAVKDQPGDFTDNAAKESAKRTAARLAASEPMLEGARQRRHAEDRRGDLRPGDGRGGLAGVRGRPTRRQAPRPTLPWREGRNGAAVSGRGLYLTANAPPPEIADAISTSPQGELCT